MPAHTWSSADGPLHFAALRHLYRTASLTPTELVSALFRRIRAADCPHVWITLADEEEVFARARALEAAARTRGSDAFPLFGIPFAVKDNIDVAGLPTTAACRDFAYIPPASAPAVERLLAAGALFIGKTNLDQFATGLTGLLSAFGATRNPFNPDYISGGSSSGSAVAVAAGLVSFALGTDTAGSGRIPAAFSHLVGLKPTRGLVSTRGLVPACRSLDCISFLTLNVDDAAELLVISKGFDPQDPLSRRDADDFDPSLLRLPISRFRLGIPAPGQLDFLGDARTGQLYAAAINRLEKLGGQRVQIDASPFLETGELLYQGPWIAERFAPLHEFHAAHPQSFHPATLQVMGRGTVPTAMDAFNGLHHLAKLRRRTEEQWALMDFLVLPTASRAFSIQEAARDPIATSAYLGRYTNFVNLLDLSALALPAGFATGGVPFGISLIAPALAEANLLALGSLFFPSSCGGVQGAARAEQESVAAGLSVPPDVGRRKQILICVVGAHLSGQPLNHQLTGIDGYLVARTRTSCDYRLFALAHTTPPKPGLMRVALNSKTSENGNSAGTKIEVEVWSIPEHKAGEFLKRIPAPMCLGNILLENGEWVKGFLCEPIGLANAEDISKFGGWLNYLAAQKSRGSDLADPLPHPSYQA